MDAEGLGRKLLLTPSSEPRRAPERQTVGTVKESHKMLTLQALSSFLNARLSQKGAAWAEERPLGAWSGSLSPKTAASMCSVLKVGGWIRGALDLQNRGAPFCPQFAWKRSFLKVFGENLRQTWGAPSLQIRRATDPIPHLKPSDLLGYTTLGEEIRAQNVFQIICSSSPALQCSMGKQDTGAQK